jgi:hypothetical protein
MRGAVYDTSSWPLTTPPLTFVMVGAVGVVTAGVVAEGLGLGDESAPAGDATRTVEPSRATVANVVTSARGKERTPQE